MGDQARTITDAPADLNVSVADVSVADVSVADVSVADVSVADVSEADDELAFDEGSAEEAVDGLPVLADVRALEPPSHVSLPAVQAAAAAATGFVAGAATLALVRRHSARKLARSRRLTTRRSVDMLPIVGGRTFLVDVYLIAKPGD
jgi:hypothetical protein